ncbi:Uncharacterized protein Adt_35462 [Abeliophyllum distichum]|uniref:Uncharacterized protein n=1 Tax=Abeliophyllum distichum TaxID=126358 RepID=A0ABD1QET2_9LAMI
MKLVTLYHDRSSPYWPKEPSSLFLSLNRLQIFFPSRSIVSRLTLLYLSPSRSICLQIVSLLLNPQSVEGLTEDEKRALRGSKFAPLPSALVPTRSLPSSAS